MLIQQRCFFSRVSLAAVADIICMQCRAAAPIPIVMAPLFWANTHYFYFRVTTLAPLKPSEATFVGPNLLHLSNLLVACFNLKHGFKVLLVLNAISVGAASS